MVAALRSSVQTTTMEAGISPMTSFAASQALGLHCHTAAALLRHRHGERTKTVGNMNMTKFRLTALAALTCISLGGLAHAQTAPAPSSPAAIGAPNVADAQALRLARAQRHMGRFDKDNNGFLTRSEYQRWYQATARRRSALTWKRHAAALFKRLDANRDSKLTIDEFVADPHFRRPQLGRSRTAVQ